MNVAKPRMISFGAMIGLVASLAFQAIAPAEAAKPEFIRDQCNETSGDGMGHECASETDLLIRPKYEDGKCGDWMCCPQNDDGQTYDCTKATNPTRSQLSDTLKGILGPRATVTDPGHPIPEKRPVAPTTGPASSGD